MTDREKVVREIEDALSDNLSKAGYIYGLSLDGLKDKALTDALALIDTQYKLIIELQNLISIGTKMMNGDDFEKHLHGNKDGILYHHYCKKCEYDWWSEEAFPNRCSKCGCEII